MCVCVSVCVCSNASTRRRGPVACTYQVSLAVPSARCAPVLRGSQNSSLSFIHEPQLEPSYPLLYPQKLSDRRLEEGAPKTSASGEARPSLGRGTRVQAAGVLTTSSCEQRLKPQWRWRCGGFSKFHVHAANVLASALVCAEPGVAYCRLRRLHLMSFGVVARKFYNFIFVSLFTQASRSQEDPQESTTPHLLKLDASD